MRPAPLAPCDAAVFPKVDANAHRHHSAKHVAGSAGRFDAGVPHWPQRGRLKCHSTVSGSPSRTPSALAHMSSPQRSRLRRRG